MAKVIFRADASLNIGIGHVQRCLTLADALRRRGASCVFVSRRQPGDLVALVAERGFRVLALRESSLPETPACAESPRHADWLGTDWQTDARETLALLEGESADWLVVDHYALDARWERAMRKACRGILAIDDLADRSHDADVLLDQNLGRTTQHYASLVPTGCKLRIGPRFALLRPEFASARPGSLTRRKPPRLERLLVNFGGVDPTNATAELLDALNRTSLPTTCQITVVMGPHAPWIAGVRKAAAAMRVPTEVKVNVANMAELMAQSDLAIGAAGSTVWERCTLGLPSVMVVLAHNQQDAAEALVAGGAALAVARGPHMKRDLQQLLDHFRADPGRLEDMVSRAKAVCDGQGVDRVADDLIQVRN